MSITNKKIFIFGGSGSLGNALISRYLKNNTLVNYSRSEKRHWKMSLRYKSNKLSSIIGDIRDYNRVENSLIRENPNIIIIAAALKHIDRCEYAVSECIATNLTGPMNVLNAIEKNIHSLKNLECVVFISTDKSTSAINAYGATKFLSERACIEKALLLQNTGIKFVIAKYGNILNSNGSIIPILHKFGQDSECQEFTLTHEDMGRFIMTLEQSVDLIQHAIQEAESGDVVIPRLTSMKIKDLFEIFSEKYNKPIKITGLRPGEKMHESLINETQSMNMIIGEKYYYIKPSFKNVFKPEQAMDYNSRMNVITKDELKHYLLELKLLQ
jgi:UDP-N-acetylglucosamine 4,6-dehydratase/5-epimerase